MVKPCEVKLVKLGNLNNKKSKVTIDQVDEVGPKIVDSRPSLSKPEQPPLKLKIGTHKVEQKITNLKQEILNSKQEKNR